MQRVPGPLVRQSQPVRHMAPDSRTNSEAGGTQHRDKGTISIEELGKPRLKRQRCKGKKIKEASIFQICEYSLGAKE